MIKLKQITKYALTALMTVSLLISCSDENETPIAPDVPQFEESDIISFDEIDKMTQTTIDGELEDDELENGRSASTGIGLEKRFYSFNAEVLAGTNTGLELEGNLNTRFTFYHALFTVIRGNFILPSGEKGFVRGAVVSDGVTYLIFEVPGLGIVTGIGLLDDNGNLEGSFNLLDSDNIGSWDAQLLRTNIPRKDVVQILSEDGRFETLISALDATELTGALQGEGLFTVFAPTDEAFSKLESIPGGETLTQILLYHVLPEQARTNRLLRRRPFQTLQGEELDVTLNEEGNIVVNGEVMLLQANIKGTNGVIQIIDDVLIPPSFAPQNIVDIALETPELSTLVTALGQASLVETLQGPGPFTVFAPNNAAFAALEALPEGEALVEVLLYHVANGAFKAADLLEKQTITTIQGDEVTIELAENGDVLLNGNIRVEMADIEASNGIIHIIEGVLLPPAPLQSIVEIASADPNFSSLVGALQAANLVGALEGEGPFTVFAPTNAAFEALEFAPEGNILTEILLYHVLSGRFDSEALSMNGIQATLQGNEVEVTEGPDGNLFVDGIEIVIADIPASNGIIHVIEEVLIPASFNDPGTIVDVAKRTPALSSLVDALVQANLVSALDGEGEFTVVAPTNAAFEALGAVNDVNLLTQVLLLHVAEGRFSFEELLEQAEVESLQGTSLEFSSEDGIDRVRVSDGDSEAEIVIKDVQANNGVVHVIDAVLLPN